MNCTMIHGFTNIKFTVVEHSIFIYSIKHTVLAFIYIFIAYFAEFVPAKKF
jgi:hypothetical protein